MAKTTTYTEVPDDGGHSGGMPQLDFATYPSQILWLLISLIVLFVGLSKFALPQISSVLEQRRDSLDRYLQEAEALKRKAEQARQSYEQDLATAKAKAHEIGAKAHADMQAEIAEDTRRAEQEIVEKQIQELKCNLIHDTIKMINFNF